MNTSRSNKAGGLGGAVAVVLLWVASTYGHITPPPEVAADESADLKALAARVPAGH